MKANLKKRTIEMTKREAKEAGRINSDKFNELQQYHNAYPNFRFKIVEAPKKKSNYKGLDYNFIENYIKKCNRDNKSEIMAEFNTLRGFDNGNRSKCERAKVASYLEVKTWFLDKFPEIAEFKETQSKKIAEILNVA